MGIRLTSKYLSKWNEVVVGNGEGTLLKSEVSSHEKGLALELKLHDLFKTKGYNVLHNVKRKGRSERSTR